MRRGPAGTIAASLTALVLVCACGESREETSGPTGPGARHTDGGSMSSIDRKQAVAMALRAFKELGSDPERYEMQVVETDTEWQVSFAGKMPRPPGDEVSFLIDKRSGALRTLLGE